MIKYDDVTKENKYNLNWPLILDHPYTILMIEGSGSGKRNVLINLIKQKDDYYSITDKIYLHVKDSYEKKYILTKTREKKMVLKILTILTLLLNIQVICKMFIKILEITAQAENIMYYHI